MSDVKSRKVSLEKDLLITLKSPRDTHISLVSCDKERVAIVNSRYSFNVHSFYRREHTFLKTKREAEKEAKKKRDDATLMDVAQDARVIDVLDECLKQLGLIGKKSRSDSSNSQSSAASQSRSEGFHPPGAKSSRQCRP